MKYDLRDATFIIPYKTDGEERRRNLSIVLRYLTAGLQTNIIISSLSSRADEKVQSMCADFGAVFLHQKSISETFNKSKAVNLGVKESRTPIISVHDADALLPPDSYLEAMNVLRDKRADGFIPFENNIMHVPTKAVDDHNGKISEGDLASFEYETTGDYYIMVGLVNFFEKSAFIKGGMMNETMSGWGFEDVEMYIRFVKLGYKIKRGEGLAYHLDHFRKELGPDDVQTNKNKCEYNKVWAMDPDRLADYVQSWPWNKGFGAIGRFPHPYRKSVIE